jgi:Tfp pilus assembly protein FimT
MDLAITLVVVAVLSCIAIPAFFSQPVVTLDHAALLFANDLRYAQNEAAISSQGTQVNFDLKQDGYTVTYQTGEAVPNPIGGADLLRTYSHDAIFRGVLIEIVEGANPQRFDRAGFALDGGKFRLKYEGDERFVFLVRGSGHLEIQGLATEWVDDGM